MMDNAARQVMPWIKWRNKLVEIIASSQKALISLTLGGFECCKSVTTLICKVGNEFSWFGWPDWPRNVSAQFFGRSGKVLYGAFSIVGMAYQSQYVNRAIPDDRVARSNHAVAATNSTISELKLNFSPVRGSILMRFRSIEPPEFILLAIAFSSKSAAKYKF